MDVVAKLNFIRMSPKKIRPVVDSIKRLTPSDAVVVLKFSDKSVARPLTKLIDSAIANAKNNYGLSEKDLTFKSIEVGPGTIYKRFRVASRGRVHPIAKRTANVTLILEGESIKKATDLEKKIAQDLQKSEILNKPKGSKNSKSRTNSNIKKRPK